MLLYSVYASYTQFLTLVIITIRAVQATQIIIQRMLHLAQMLLDTIKVQALRKRDLPFMFDLLLWILGCSVPKWSAFPLPNVISLYLYFVISIVKSDIKSGTVIPG